MSTIKIGKININRSARSYDTYVASICRSESGFVRPYLAASTAEVDTFYGSFPFKDMLCKFIEDGIPVLLLPMITPMSETNRCTLRLNDPASERGAKFPSCHPRYGGGTHPLNTYGWEPPTGPVAEGKEHYVHVLDFSNVPESAFMDPNSYIITRVGDERLLIYPCINDSPHPNTDVPNSVYEQSLGIIADEGGSFIGKSLFIDRLKGYIKGGWTNAYVGLQYETYVDGIPGVTCMDIFDIIRHKVFEYLEKEPIVVTERDYRRSYTTLYSSFEDYKVSRWGEERRKFRGWLARQDYLLCDAMLAVNCCVSIFDDMVAIDDGGIEADTSSWYSLWEFYDDFSYRLSATPEDDTHYAVGEDYPWRSKGLPYLSLCISSSSPNSLIDYSNMEGFSTFVLPGPDMDAISDYTEQCKVAEFYAKGKGSRGASIKIKIEPAYRRPRCYELTLSSGEYKEHASVTTGEEVEGYTHLSRLGEESNLVDAKLFNYALSNGKRICTDDFDELSGGEAFDTSRVLDVELPAGEWTLGRCAREVFDYECARDTLDILRESEYYPDFLLVNEMDYGVSPEEVSVYGSLSHSTAIEVRGLDNNRDYLEQLLSYAEAKHTQVLVRVEEGLYAPQPPKIPTPLVTGQSRLLYFKGCYVHNGTVFPCFYPYASNFLHGDFIKRLPYGVIYEGGDDSLQDLGINALSCNNYYYNYLTVREPHGTQEPNAVIRFVASSISRVFYRGKYDFIGAEAEALPSVIGGKVSKAKSLLPILGDVAYSYAFDADAVSIFLCFTIPSIVNKEYRLNITLTTT